MAASTLDYPPLEAVLAQYQNFILDFVIPLLRTQIIGIYFFDFTRCSRQQQELVVPMIELSHLTLQKLYLPMLAVLPWFAEKLRSFLVFL